MAEWRFGRGWSEAELKARVDDAKRLGGYPSEEPRHWRRYHTETVLAVESPGPPEPAGRGRGCISLSWWGRCWWRSWG